MERIHTEDEDLQDIGDLTHYKGKLFSGIVFDTDQDGDLTEEYTILNGLKEGIGKTYYKSGNVKQEITLKDDKMNGVSKFYSESGIIFKVSEYRNNELIRSKSITDVLSNSLTFNVLSPLFISFDYFTLKEDEMSFELVFTEDDFYDDYDKFNLDMNDPYGKSINKVFSGLTLSISPFKLSDDDYGDDPIIDLPGVYGFSDSSSSESIFVIGNIPEVEDSGLVHFRTSRTFDDIDQLITYIDKNFVYKDFNELSHVEQKRLTYIKDK